MTSSFPSALQVGFFPSRSHQPLFPVKYEFDVSDAEFPGAFYRFFFKD